MLRPVDVLIDFLHAEEARGVTHVYLDEETRALMRNLAQRRKSLGPASATRKPHAADTSTTAPAASAAASSPTPASPTTAAPTTSLASAAELAMEFAPPPDAAPPVSIAPPVLEGATKADKLAMLRELTATWAPARSLGSFRETTVFSAGNPDARLMFIGDTPGQYEEKEGTPFAGKAGVKLDLILKAMGITREDVYLTNVLKFRPDAPKQTISTRQARPAEIAACLPLLHAEIDVVQPACIVALGPMIGSSLLGLSGPIDAMRGSWQRFNGIPVRITYHPAYLLLNENNHTIKRQFWEDMLMVMEELIMPISAKQRSFFLPSS